MRDASGAQPLAGAPAFCSDSGAVFYVTKVPLKDQIAQTIVKHALSHKDR